MATITLRPTSATGTSWSNISNAYDGSTSTSATVATTSSNYSSRAGTFNFDTSVIPSGATINSATLYVNCKSSNSSRTKLYADINGNSSSRVINVTIGTTKTDRTADVTSRMSSLNTIKLMQYNSRTTSYTFTLYEIYIEVDYTASTTYTVRFLDWDNSVISTQTVTSGGSATPPPNPTRDGYTFSGWLGNYTNVTADVDIIAQYTQNSSGGEVGTSVKNIKIGSSTIDKLYLGTSQILKAYLGNILLYSYSTGGDSGGSLSSEIFDIYMKNINIGDTSITNNGVTLDIIGTDWTKNGDGIVFADNSSIRYNHGLCDSPSGSFTIMVDFMAEAGTDIDRYLFFWGDYNNDTNSDFYVYSKDNVHKWYDYSSRNGLELPSDTFLTRDKYFFIYDGTSVTVKKGTTTLASKSMTIRTIPETSNVVYFGNAGIPGKYLDGTIYEIALFDKALTDDEINAIL